MSIELRPATPDDVPLLAAMNQQLRVDEGSRHPMNLEQLTIRMRRWLEGDYHAVLFFKEGDVAGYP